MLGFGGDESDDDESFSDVLRDDDEIFERLALGESSAEFLDRDLTMTGESGVGDESLDASRLEGEDDVGLVQPGDGTSENVTDLDAVGVGRLIEGGGSLTSGGDETLAFLIDVDDSNRNYSSDGEYTSEISGETLTVSCVSVGHLLMDLNDVRSLLSGNESAKSTEKVDNDSSIHDLGDGAVSNDTNLCVCESGDDGKLRSDESTLERQNDTVLLRVGRVDLELSRQYCSRY